MKDRIIKIRRNYGVLGAEKRTVYTYGAEHVHATWSEEITAEIPNGWELCKNIMDQTIVEAPCGQTYMINDVLAGDDRPCFFAIDPNWREVFNNLKVIKEN